MLSCCLYPPFPLLLHPSWIAGSPRYRMPSPYIFTAYWAGQDMFALGDLIGSRFFLVVVIWCGGCLRCLFPPHFFTAMTTFLLFVWLLWQPDVPHYSTPMTTRSLLTIVASSGSTKSATMATPALLACRADTTNQFSAMPYGGLLWRLVILVAMATLTKFCPPKGN